MPCCLGNGGLNVKGRRIDVTLQVEFEGYSGDTLAIGGRHGVKTGNGGKLPFEGGRYGAGHRFRACTRQVGGNLDRRVIDPRQVIHREKTVGEDAEYHDGQHDEAGHHGPAYEQRGNVHREESRLAPGCPAGAGVCAVPSFADFRTSTLAPGISRICPSVTTVSPGCIPCRMTISPPWEIPA